MTRRMTACLLLLLGLYAAPAAASDWAWVMSVPHAISDQNTYKVRILEIDGEPQRELLRYPVSPGRHEVVVELMLVLEWEPDLREGGPVPAVKRIEVQAEGGRSYLLAGKVDVDAPAESQLDQSYWEPFVYAVQ